MNEHEDLLLDLGDAKEETREILGGQQYDSEVAPEGAKQ